MHRWRLAVLAIVLLLPAAGGEAPWIYQGGAPGVLVKVADVDITTASQTRAAIIVDPTEPVNVSISISPPPNVTWRVRSVFVGLLLQGPGSQPPPALARNEPADADLPSGFTVVVNKTIDLGALEKAGAGTFLMRAAVIDENETTLFTQEFYVRVPTTPASLLTVQGAAITAVTLATGYGFWQIAKDIKEFRDVWDRHRKKIARAKLDVIGAAEHLAEETAARMGHGLDKAVALHRAVQDSEKQLGLVRWSATGLGLGGVTIAWLQFLGYLALDSTGFLVAALEGGAVALTLALLANALLNRKRKMAPAPEAPGAVPAMVEDVPERSLMPADAQTGAPQVDLAHALSEVVGGDPLETPVQPVDKRG